jgi:hypothetical protein
MRIKSPAEIGQGGKRSAIGWIVDAGQAAFARIELDQLEKPGDVIAIRMRNQDVLDLARLRDTVPRVQKQAEFVDEEPRRKQGG